MAKKVITVRDKRSDKSKPGKARFVQKPAPVRLKTTPGKRRYA